MDMGRFNLANEFHKEHCEIQTAFLGKIDLSVIDGEADESIISSYVRSPEEATGKRCKAIRISGDAAKKKRWMKVLPTLTGVERVELSTNAVSEELMRAVCQHGDIERLSFGNTRLDSLEQVAKLSRLTNLWVGSSPRITSFSPLSSLRNLKSLGIQGNFPHVDGIEALSELNSLEALFLCGAESKDLTIESLGPVSALSHLKFLNLTAIRVRSGGLKPLCELPRLEYLSIDPFHMNIWQHSDIVALHEAHPALQGSLIHRVATEPEIARRLQVGR